MGTWMTLHYGGPVAMGLTKSLCGLDLGEPETWGATRQGATYRPYELLTSPPENTRPCPTCRQALDFWETKELRARREEAREVIARARRRIPMLLESGKWRRIERLAHAAAEAKRRLKAPKEER